MTIREAEALQPGQSVYVVLHGGIIEDRTVATPATETDALTGLLFVRVEFAQHYDDYEALIEQPGPLPPAPRYTYDRVFGSRAAADHVAEEEARAESRAYEQFEAASREPEVKHGFTTAEMRALLEVVGYTEHDAEPGIWVHKVQRTFTSADIIASLEAWRLHRTDRAAIEDMLARAGIPFEYGPAAVSVPVVAFDAATETYTLTSQAVLVAFGNDGRLVKVDVWDRPS